MITKSETFQEHWNEYLDKPQKEEDLRKIISECSPHHPNENMRWLYDQLLMKLARKFI